MEIKQIFGASLFAISTLVSIFSFIGAMLQIARAEFGNAAFCAIVGYITYRLAKWALVDY